MKIDSRSESGITVIFVLVMVMVFLVFLWGSFYTFKVGRRAVHRIASDYTNRLDEADNMLVLSTNYDAGPINPDTGEVLLDIPERTAGWHGNWKIWRTTNWTDFDVVTTITTDRDSAQQLVNDSFCAETNMNGIAGQCVFFGATLQP